MLMSNCLATCRYETPILLRLTDYCVTAGSSDLPLCSQGILYVSPWPRVVCIAHPHILPYSCPAFWCSPRFFSQAAIWQRVLTCPLFPLRRCLDTVRREFARLCCGLMDQYLDPDLLEHLAGISEEVRSRMWHVCWIVFFYRYTDGRHLCGYRLG